MRQSSLSMRPSRTRKPPVSTGMRVFPLGGRVASQRCRAGRSSTGASSSMRCTVRSAPRLRSVRQGSETNTRLALSSAVGSSGRFASTLPSTSWGVPRRR